MKHISKMESSEGFLNCMFFNEQIYSLTFFVVHGIFFFGGSIFSLNVFITLFLLNHKPEKDFEVLDPNLHHSKQLELWKYCL